MPHNVNITSNVTDTFDRIISSIEKKYSQLANVITALKNSTQTFFVGSETKRQQNINKICGEFIYLISTQTKNNEDERLNVTKLNDSGSGRISTRLTHKTLTKDVNNLFNLIQSELLNQPDKNLSITEGYSDNSVNIMLATLYQLYQQADKYTQDDINYTNNSSLKFQILGLINNLIIKSNSESTENGKAMTLLKNMNEKYKNELDLQIEKMKEKIKYKVK
ncbi:MULTISPECIES: hypothetical protein [Proteus]|uniref:Uncharacterized protein n=1 Tax=Proteus penneri TaxID=102862 RepID=A0ABS0VZ37_9GAMM|nr:MULTISPECIES: hypothetical protein [Proteus]MBJ2116298.1 hypothetical protein [Proteus penneri]NBM13314.1 hypothetical protein [Proteus sp. G2670]NBM32851.1 hypothetical protein [Proteus sp. G2664]NBM69274.1 hypothetical protein [Proteus sp. G2663]NBM87824.1 hypothetical protein [Proteus sp. G2661]